MITLSDSVQLC